MTTDAAGPREQAIREKLATWHTRTFEQRVKYGDQYASLYGDIEYLLSRLDALRPEEPPQERRCVACEQGQHQQCLGGACQCIHSSSEVRPEEPPPQPDRSLVDRALAFVAEFKGDQHCFLNCDHAEALAAEVASLRAQLTEAQRELEFWRSDLLAPGDPTQEPTT